MPKKIPEGTGAKVYAQECSQNTQTKGLFILIMGVLFTFLFTYACILSIKTAIADTADPEIATGSEVFIGKQGLHIDRSRLPQNGMTMLQVETAFGAAVKKIPEVGIPPISRWEYDGYTVYFEHELVLHVVVHPLTS